MNNQLIKTCQELNECEGMGESPIKLILKNDNTFRRLLKVIDENKYVIYYSQSGKKFYSYEILKESPLLVIDDRSEWSSAKFLARAGWDARLTTMQLWFFTLYSDAPVKLRPRNSEYQIDKMVGEVGQSLKEGNHELAYMQAIILLYKIDREAYNKGIEPLLEGKG